MLPNPSTFAKEHEGPVSIADFLGGVCRPLDPQAVKSVAVLFDAHVSISEFGSTSTLTKLVAENKMAELPHPVHFPSVLPEPAKLDIIVDNTGDGFVSVLKVIYFERPVPTNVALKLCSGQAHVPVHRHGPWTVKKGLQQALNQVAGVHVRWHVLEDKGDKQGQKLPRSTSSQWSPENDELAEGIRYINAHAPECDGLNEQTYWILTNIKADSGSPAAGWPEIKVRAMCQNKSRGLSGAIPKSEFPLTTYSLWPSFVDHVLNLIYPLLMSTAIMMLGCPGVGKTPAIIAMCMAIGRHHVRRLHLQGDKPGWRRAKSFDNFRQRAPQVQEALFLDDPSGRRTDIADLKAFVTSDEDGTVSGRYNDARLARNQMRAFAFKRHRRGAKRPRAVRHYSELQVFLHAHPSVVPRRARQGHPRRHEASHHPCIHRDGIVRPLSLRAPRGDRAPHCKGQPPCRPLGRERQTFVRVLQAGHHDVWNYLSGGCGKRTSHDRVSGGVHGWLSQSSRLHR